MRMSARNQLKGKVVEIQNGAVNGIVVIELKGGEKIASSITMDSIRSLDLKPGKDVYAIVKASSVMVGVD